MVETQSDRRPRTVRWGWWILVVVSALFGLNGVGWFFFGPDSSVANMAENIRISVAELESAYPEAAVEAAVNARRVAVYLTAIGVMALFAAWWGLRQESRRAWAITWVLVLTTAAIGFVEMWGGGLGPLGVSMLALAVVGLTGQLLAGRPPTDVRTEEVESQRRHRGKEA